MTEFVCSLLYITDGREPATLWRCQLNGRGLVQLRRLPAIGIAHGLTISDDILHILFTINADETDIGILLYNTSSSRWINNEVTHSFPSSTRHENVKVQCATATRDAIFFATETLLRSQGTVLRRRGNATVILSESLRSCASMVYVAEKRQTIDGALRVHYSQYFHYGECD